MKIALFSIYFYSFLILKHKIFPYFLPLFFLFKISNEQIEKIYKVFFSFLFCCSNFTLIKQQRTKKISMRKRDEGGGEGGGGGIGKIAKRIKIRVYRFFDLKKKIQPLPLFILIHCYPFVFFFFFSISLQR